MLLKPLEGLEVGQTYEILVSDTTVWLDDNSYSPMHDLKSPIKEYELFEELFDDWFAFQVLPETITRQIREELVQVSHEYSEMRAEWFADTDAEYRRNHASEYQGQREAIFDAAVSVVKELLEGDTKDE